MADGAHTLVVKARDQAGNQSTPSDAYSWTADIVAPTTSITGQPDPTTTATSALFTFMANESGVTYYCSLDGATYTQCSSGITFDSLSPGPHAFDVHSRDAAGNTGPDAAFLWTIAVEENLPCNSVEGHAHGNQNFQATVSGKKATVHVEVDGDCDYDKKAGKYFLHHSKVKVEISGAGVSGKLIDAKQNSNGKKSDISGMKLVPGDGGFPTAILNGMWQGSRSWSR